MEEKSKRKNGHKTLILEILILEKMNISALGELIRTKKRDEISKIVSFLSGNIHHSTRELW